MPTANGSRRERPIFGVTGWKNAGKTTLTERLVAEFVRRGWTVATIKHAHHAADIDQPGTDSFRHRAAGATEVALVTGQRYAIMREQAEPTLAEVLARLAPADLVLVEGFKRDPHPKIEVRADNTRPMDVKVHNIVAIAADQPPAAGGLPWFARDDVGAIADFIAARVAGRARAGALPGEDAGRLVGRAVRADGEGAGLVLRGLSLRAEEGAGPRRSCRAARRHAAGEGAPPLPRASATRRSSSCRRTRR